MIFVILYLISSFKYSYTEIKVNIELDKSDKLFSNQLEHVEIILKKLENSQKYFNSFLNIS